MTDSDTFTPAAVPPRSMRELLRVEDLKMHFPVRGGVFGRQRGTVKAVDGVSLTIAPGETLGLVGESGCGKSTLGKCIVRLLKPTAGRIHFGRTEISDLSQAKMRPFRRDIQMIFQDPADSLNPRMTVGEIVSEPLHIHRVGTREERGFKVRALLDRVGLPGAAADRYPFEFSGGQRQRIGIARALALNPKLIVCDEPVSALDVSVQSQILNLLLDLQQEFGLSYLFIAHDLAVVKYFSDRVAVMYLGKLVEVADANTIFTNSLHAYTQALIDAIPVPDPRQRRKREILRGEVPSPIDPPPGCAFARRSPIPHMPEAELIPGEFREVRPGHWVELHPATVRDYESYRQG